MRKIACVVLVLLTGGVLLNPLSASSHREAPLISQDPLADNTDVYAFVSPERPGPRDADRELHSARSSRARARTSGSSTTTCSTKSWSTTTGDARRGHHATSSGSRPSSAIRNTFLYNTGQVTSLDDPDLNVRQFYHADARSWSAPDGSRNVIGQNLHVMPANVGAQFDAELHGRPRRPECTSSRPTASGPSPARATIRSSSTSARRSTCCSCARSTARPAAAVDGLGNYNVHTIALEIPISRLTRTGTAPGRRVRSKRDASASGRPPSRPATTTRTPGNAVSQRRLRAGVAPRHAACQRGRSSRSA